MNDVHETVAPANQPATSVWRKVCWLASGVVAVLVLSVTASFAPAEMKRLFVFPMVVGAIGGYVLGWLAAEFDLHPRRGFIVACAALVLLGGVNLGWVSYRRFAEVQARWVREHPDEAAAMRMVQRLSEFDPKLADGFESRRPLLDPTFLDYLEHRTKGLGTLRRPWPVVIWGGELILASVAGVFVFRRRSRSAKGETVPDRIGHEEQG